MRLCFFIRGRRYCIWIPIWIRPPWPPKPDGNGDPWRHLGEFLEEPDPSPWRENLEILATVATLARHARGDLRGRLERVVHEEVAEIRKQLPEDIELELEAKAE